MRHAKYLWILLISSQAFSQTIEESAIEREMNEEEETDLVADVEHLRKHPLDLNAATEADLKAFRIITDLQIHHFMLYRQHAGPFIDIHELQTIPYWHADLIRLLLPYISAGKAEIASALKARLKKGEHSVLLRATRRMERALGYTLEDGYAGSREKYLFKYKYRYKNLLQYGITAEKDPGEKLRPDFLSLHIFIRNAGWLRCAVVGDFSVNMGQGLIQYNAMGTGKSSDVLLIKKQADILKPYTSSAENNFKRGAGLTVGKNNWQATGFISLVRLSASLAQDPDSETDHITSISMSGLHRTKQEIARKNSAGLFSAGGNITYKKRALSAGLNAVQYDYSLPLLKGTDAYQNFDSDDKSFTNVSADISYTFRNVHVFSELALSRRGGKAAVAGAMISLHRDADIALVYRDIEAEYHAVEAKAFTESGEASNEKGLYTGIVVRLLPGISAQVYSDLYHHPFLKYRKSGAGVGFDRFLQLIYQAGKRASLYMRYQHERFLQDVRSAGIPALATVDRQKWRLHYTCMVSSLLRMQGRTEFSRWKKEKEYDEGLMAYLELGGKISKRISTTMRVTAFETLGFDSRIYSYEPDLPYAAGLPFFDGKGVRYLVIGRFDLFKDVNVALKWSQTIYSGRRSVGTALELTEGNARSELKIQLLYSVTPD